MRLLSSVSSGPSHYDLCCVAATYSGATPEKLHWNNSKWKLSMSCCNACWVYVIGQEKEIFKKKCKHEE